MAIGKSHLTVGKAAQVTLAINAARLDEDVFSFAAISAAVHAQRAANRARNAAEKRQPRDTGRLRRARHHHIENRSAGGDTLVFDLHLVESAAEPDHHAGNTAITHDQVGAGTDDSNGNFGL